MKNKAFTLTELLIALAIIGILIAILLPVISNIMPDQNALMAKRAYHGIQTVTSSLLNDEACYPNKTQALEDDARIGFDDGFGYSDCLIWGGTKNETSIDTEDANTKFITLFFDKLDVKSNDGDTYTTKDKMTWTVQNKNLSSTNDDPSIEIVVDVNGPDKPNCKDAADTTGDSCTTKKDFDRFTVKIHADGKLDIAEEWAANAVGIDADVTGEP